jgi:hypothetical protein
VIARACYCNRAEAQRSVDFKTGVDAIAALDRALQSAADNIDAQLHRRFYPVDATVLFDWPNYQYAYPWRVWFNQYDLTVMTALTTGGVSVPLNQVFLRPQNNAMNGRPWYTNFELDRSGSATLGGASATPQNAVAVAGTWGYGADADQVATLAAGAGSSDSTVTLSDGSKCGPGDLIVLGYGRGTAPFPSDTAGHAGALAPYTGERMLVYDVSAVATGLTQASGLTTASDSDVTLTTTGSGALNAGEVIVLDSERMLVEQVVSGVASVRRAWDGTVIAAHSGAAVNALRLMSVLRNQYGTPGTTYLSGAAVFRHRVPPLVHDLAVAESVNRILQEGSGYARTVGGGESAAPAPGIALTELWDEAVTAHGRKARIRVI